MALQPARMRDFDTSQNKPAALLEGVHVIPYANPNHP
jgi:hypothetical protein